MIVTIRYIATYVHCGYIYAWLHTVIFLVAFYGICGGLCNCQDNCNCKWLLSPAITIMWLIACWVECHIFQQDSILINIYTQYIATLEVKVYSLTLEWSYHFMVILVLTNACVNSSEQYGIQWFIQVQ